MFHDIFKKIKRSRKKYPLIIADIHEKNSLVLSELYKEIKLEKRHLDVGDYLIGKFVIERKTISDFITSMINKRLIKQLSQMPKNKSLLIIEGNFKEIKNDNISKAVRGLVLSIITDYQIPIIFSYDYEDTAKYLVNLAKRQIKTKNKISLHSKIPKDFNEQKSYILEAFPNIGPKKSEKLLEKFKTIKNTINAAEEELRAILKLKTKEFIDLLEK